MVIDVAYLLCSTIRRGEDGGRNTVTPIGPGRPGLPARAGSVQASNPPRQRSALVSRHRFWAAGRHQATSAPGLPPATMASPLAPNTGLWFFGFLSIGVPIALPVIPVHAPSPGVLSASIRSDWSWLFLAVIDRCWFLAVLIIIPQESVFEVHGPSFYALLRHCIIMFRDIRGR